MGIVTHGEKFGAGGDSKKKGVKRKIARSEGLECQLCAQIPLTTICTMHGPSDGPESIFLFLHVNVIFYSSR